jgi:hypothetical protein
VNLRRAIPSLAGLLLLLASPVGAQQPTPVDPALPDDHVVARVNHDGHAISITAGRLRRFAAAEAAAGSDIARDPRALVDRLIEFELLAIVAAARGHADAPEVRDAGRRAMVQRWLVADFAPGNAAEDIPELLLRRAYERNLVRFKSPEGRRVAHILVSTPDAQRPDDPTLDARARALSEALLADLEANPAEDVDGFGARVSVVEGAASDAGLGVRFERLSPFGRKGSRFVEAFVEKAFGGTREGQLVGPFPTEFGWHLIYVEAVYEKRDRSFEQAVEEIRGLFLPEHRQRQLSKLAAKLARDLEVVVDAEPLRQLDVRPEE